MLTAAVGPRFDRTLSHRRRVAYRERPHEELDLADGLRGWLDEAAGLGLRLAVASSSPLEWLTTHLGRAGVLDTFEVLREETRSGGTSQRRTCINWRSTGCR
jgi:putative hydrolase of the HAD superfamily